MIKKLLVISSRLWLGLLVHVAWAAEPAGVGGAQALPTAVDLRPVLEKWGLHTRLQGKRNTCSVFTVAGALEFAAAKKQRRGERYSVEFLNWAANQASGEAEDGGFFSHIWNGFAARGVCLEQTLPYRSEFEPALAPCADALAEAKTRLALGLGSHWIKEWDVKTGLSQEEFLSVKRTLNQGWPVCGGFRWPKQAKWTDDVLQMCAADAVYDGHSVLLVGYRDEPGQPGGGVFLFRNSGQGGRHGAMSYTYAQTYMNDALWIDYEPK